MQFRRMREDSRWAQGLSIKQLILNVLLLAAPLVGATPVDASGQLASRRFNGPAEFRVVLLQQRDAFVRSVTERLLSYALYGDLKRGRIHYDDMPTVREAVARAATRDYRWSAIVEGIVRSLPFRYERADTSTAQ